MAVKDVATDVTGNVWKVVAAPGEAVEADQTLVIMEAMKMEIPVVAPAAGKVVEILVEEGEAVGEGEVVARVEV
jgi:acetyl-CoA carboxylase biotin carboxyl carrier protein